MNKTKLAYLATVLAVVVVLVLGVTAAVRAAPGPTQFGVKCTNTSDGKCVSFKDKEFSCPGQKIQHRLWARGLEDSVWINQPVLFAWWEAEQGGETNQINKHEYGNSKLVGTKWTLLVSFTTPAWVKTSTLTEGTAWGQPDNNGGYELQARRRCIDA